MKSELELIEKIRSVLDKLYHRKVKSQGQYCDSTFQCRGNLVCQNSICVNLPGAACDDNSECNSGHCLNGKCLGELYDFCDSSTKCIPGLDCVSGKCLVKDLGQCSEDNECGSQMCLSNNKKCAKRKFYMSDGYASENGSGSHCWRGYLFEVSHLTNVTGLIAGTIATNPTMSVAIYEMDGNTLQSVLVNVDCTRSGRGQEYPVTPLVLKPGKRYMIGLGSNASRNGNNAYNVNNIDPEKIVQETPISYWSQGRGSFGCSQPATSNVGSSDGGSHSTMRDVGLVFGIHPTQDE